ncbi:hypothetical protein BDB01DRAFT_790458 [Pilobolus umbonatus]|nr:hypothetical protein BDB01DRAFT_790458 [Pilobolus umbonatus]
MDPILLKNSSKYLAENCIRAIIVPSFFPSIAYSVVMGGLAVALLEKYKRQNRFLPYLYFGVTALLYALSKVFTIIFSHEERNMKDDSIDDITHENVLYGALLIDSLASYFLIFALFSLIDKWIRYGLKRCQYLSTTYIRVLSAFFSFVPLTLTLVGDGILITETKKNTEKGDLVKIALSLKLVGAIFYIILTMIYFILLNVYSWPACISINIADRMGSPFEADKKNFWYSMKCLFIIGILTLLRHVYNVYIVAAVIINGPFWDTTTHIALVFINGVLLMLVVYILNLSRIKEELTNVRWMRVMKLSDTDPSLSLLL